MSGRYETSPLSRLAAPINTLESTRASLLRSFVECVLLFGALAKIPSAIIKRIVISVVSLLPFRTSENQSVHEDGGFSISSDNVECPGRGRLGTPRPSNEPFVISGINNSILTLRKRDKSVGLVKRLFDRVSFHAAFHWSTSNGLLKYSRYFIILFGSLLSPILAQSQQITIQGFVHDTNGTVYAGGSGVAVLVPQNVMYTVNQTNPVPVVVPISQLDSFGHFSIVLTNTSVINQQSSNPQWQFSFTSAQYTNPTTKYSFTMSPLALTSSQDITATITPQAALLPTNGGSGIVNPGTQYQIPLYPTNGSTVSPSNITTDATKNNLNVPGSVTTGGNTATTGNTSTGGNLSVGGPRPYIDVTAYGAVGNNSHDDTTAIQNAINTFCTGQTIANGGSIYFPPGTYKVSQPQTPSTSPVFTICSGIHILGGNSAEQIGLVISAGSPSSTIISSPGASPNAAPVFQCIASACAGGVTFENITIAGYNEDVYIEQSSNNKFINANLTFPQSTEPTGMTDNAPLKICDSVWNYYEGGQIVTNGTTTIPGVLLCTDSTPGNFTQVGLSYFENILMAGGGFVYQARVNNSGSPGGGMVFRNITLESATTDFFTVNVTGGSALGGISNITFDHVGLSDSSNVSLINFNAPSVLSGVYVKNSAAGQTAVKMTQGTLNACTVYSDGASAGDPQVEDGSGNPIGGCQTQNSSGFDYITDTTIAARLQSDLKNQFANVGSQGFMGPAFRATVSGSAFSTLALDPAVGILFGEGSNYGFSTAIKSSALNETDLYFSKTLPPTSVAGTATTGGSLAAGTYYYYVRSSSTGISTQCSDSTDSLVSAGVVVGSPNDAVALTWTLPSTNAPSAPEGFCVYRSTVSFATVEDQNVTLVTVVTPGSATSYTDTGSGTPGGNWSSPIPNYVKQGSVTALAASLPPLTATGPVPALTGTGACLTADLTTQKGAWIGSVECTNTTGSSTLIITTGVTAPNGWACNASDVTTANILRQSSTSPTACTIAGTVNANDVLTFTAVAY